LKNTPIRNFLQILPVGAGDGQQGQTDGHDGANSHFSQLCKRALKDVGSRFKDSIAWVNRV